MVQQQKADGENSGQPARTDQRQFEFDKLTSMDVDGGIDTLLGLGQKGDSKSLVAIKTEVMDPTGGEGLSMFDVSATHQHNENLKKEPSDRWTRDTTVKGGENGTGPKQHDAYPMGTASTTNSGAPPTHSAAVPHLRSRRIRKPSEKRLRAVKAAHEAATIKLEKKKAKHSPRSKASKAKPANDPSTTPPPQDPTESEPDMNPEDQQGLSKGDHSEVNKRRWACEHKVKVEGKGGLKAAGGARPDDTSAAKLHSAGGDGGEGFIGAYSPAARKLRLERYHKKRKARKWKKRICYGIRKLQANERPRVNGRFVKTMVTAESKYCPRDALLLNGKTMATFTLKSPPLMSNTGANASTATDTKRGDQDSSLLAPSLLPDATSMDATSIDIQIKPDSLLGSVPQIGGSVPQISPSLSWDDSDSGSSSSSCSTSISTCIAPPDNNRSISADLAEALRDLEDWGADSGSSGPAGGPAGSEPSFGAVGLHPINTAGVIHAGDNDASHATGFAAGGGITPNNPPTLTVPGVDLESGLAAGGLGASLAPADGGVSVDFAEALKDLETWNENEDSEEEEEEHKFSSKMLSSSMLAQMHGGDADGDGAMNEWAGQVGLTVDESGPQMRSSTMRPEDVADTYGGWAELPCRYSACTRSASDMRHPSAFNVNASAVVRTPPTPLAPSALSLSAIETMETSSPHISAKLIETMETSRTKYPDLDEEKAPILPRGASGDVGEGCARGASELESDLPQKPAALFLTLFQKYCCIFSPCAAQKVLPPV